MPELVRAKRQSGLRNLSSPDWPLYFLGLAVVSHFGFCLLAWNPYDISYVSDEGSYLVLAKSLAVNAQYRFISLPEEPLHGKYPPIYPSILSVIWMAAPEFPSNVLWFRGISILFGCLFLVGLQKLCATGFSLNIKETAIVLLVFALHPASLSASTAIHSEALFLVVSVIILMWAFSHQLLPFTTKISSAVGIGLLLGVLLNIRLAGVSLAVAVLLHFAFSRRYRDVALVASIVSVLFVPWLLWSWIYGSAEIYPGYTFYSNYFRDWRRLINHEGFLELLKFNAISLFFGIPKICFFPYQTDSAVITQLTYWLGIPFHYFFWKGFFITWSERTRLFHIYILLTLGLFLVWPYEAQERFLVVLLPFFYIFFRLGTRGRMISGQPVALPEEATKSLPVWIFLPGQLFIAMLFVCLTHHAESYCATRIRARTDFKKNHEHIDSCFKWIRCHTGVGEVLTADLDVVFFLHTGRKVRPLVPFFQQEDGLWRLSDDALLRFGVTHLIRSIHDFAVLPPEIRGTFSKALEADLAQSTFPFKKVFSSADSSIEVYAAARRGTSSAKNDLRNVN